MLRVSLGVCNMSLGMLCAFWNIYKMESYGCQTCSGITQFVLENMNGAKGRLGERIAAVHLYWLHSISWVDLTFSHWWVMGHCGPDVVRLVNFPVQLHWIAVQVPVPVWKTGFSLCSKYWQPESARWTGANRVRLPHLCIWFYPVNHKV
jgi:hypothetical protein